MKDEDFNGKKLGFISQEIGREINTLGSKANHAEIQKLVVKMKLAPFYLSHSFPRNEYVQGREVFFLLPI